MPGSALDERLAAAALPVLVDVSAPSCVPCERLAAVLPALARRFAGQVEFVQIDAESERGFVERSGVRSFPTLLLFREGICVDRLRGFEGYTALVRWVAERIEGGVRAATGRERDFEAQAGAAEDRYAAATTPAAEALGRVLGASFEAHERLVAGLQADVEAGGAACEAARSAIRESHEAMLTLAAPELAVQREVTAAALAEFGREIEAATARLVSEEAAGVVG